MREPRRRRPLVQQHSEGLGPFARRLTQRAVRQEHATRAGDIDVTRVTVQGGAITTTTTSPVDWYFNANLLGSGTALELLEGGGVWISGSFAAGRAYYEIGAYGLGSLPTSISGVDFLREGAELCFGRALDLHEGTGVWISGTCAAGEAEYHFGAYPPNLLPYLSGVAFAVRNGPLGYGQGLDLQEGNNLWISGSITGGEAEYLLGLKTPYSLVRYVWAPDAAPGATITAGDQQGNIYHSGPSAELARRLYVDAETAPGAAGLPIAVQFGDTNDLDTVSVWTNIGTYTLSSEKSGYSDSFISGTIPARRLLRMNVGTIVGTPKDATIGLEVLVPLVAP